MTPDPAFFWLTLIASIPAVVGAALVSLKPSPRASRAVAFASASMTLLASVWYVVVHGLSSSEVRTWIDYLGASHRVGLDALSVPLFVWVSAAVVIALVSADDGPSVTGGILLLQAATLGWLTALDVLLWLGFLGCMLLLVARLSGRLGRVLSHQMVGVALLLGFVASVSAMELRQTGFRSTDLSRWWTLALFPSEERALLVLGGAGVVATLLWLPSALRLPPRSAEIAILGCCGVLAGYFALRLVFPLSAQGAVAVAGWGRACGLSLLVFGATGRELPRRFVGYQGLFISALFSLDVPGVGGAAPLILASTIGFVGLGLSTRRVESVYFRLYLVWAGVWLALVPLASRSVLWAGASLLALLVLLVRPTRVPDVPAPESGVGAPRSLTQLVPLLALVALTGVAVLGAERWRGSLAPDVSGWLESLSGAPVEDGEP